MDSSATAATLGNSSLGQGRVTLRELCCLFCCPPWPSAIVSKLAFTPPEPSYSIQIDNDEQNHRFQFIEGRAEWPHGFEELKDIEVFYTRSSRNQKIACMMVRPCGNEARYTILFSHANAVDLGHMSSFFYVLGYRLNCNVFSYDYSGYGCSSGKATERNLYADIQCAYEALLSRYNVSPEKIVLYGQSIGTVPTIDLASKHVGIGAVILHSPLMSGMRVAFPATKRTWCFDAFPSIEKIVKVSSPTLVIHGVEDEVIDFSHGLAIHEKCPSSVEPLWVHGAGHNDIELSPAFLIRLRDFIDNEAGPINRQRLEEERHNGTASTSVSQANGVAAQVVHILQSTNKNGTIPSRNHCANSTQQTRVHRVVVENESTTVKTSVQPTSIVIDPPPVDTIINKRRSSIKSDKSRQSSSSTKYGSTSTPPNA